MGICHRRLNFPQPETLSSFLQSWGRLVACNFTCTLEVAITAGSLTTVQAPLVHFAMSTGGLMQGLHHTLDSGKHAWNGGVLPSGLGGRRKKKVTAGRALHRRKKTARHLAANI